MKKKPSLLYRFLRWIVNKIYPKAQVQGEENLLDEPMLIVGNHCQLHGPVYCELRFPIDRYTWCAGEMMHLKDVPAYSYKDFWSRKPKILKPFFKLASYLIAPLSVCVFNNAQTIGVYHDARAVSTFKQTVQKLQDGTSVVIFPEYDEPYNHILYDFREKFIDVAKLYYKRTKKEVSFVPLYIAPNLRIMCLGKPIRFCADNPIEEERVRIREYLMKEITDMACALPEHRVVPYRNVPKREFPSNKETAYENTGS